MSQGRSPEKENFSINVAGWSFLAFAVIILLAALLNGCAAYPRTPALIPGDVLIEPIGFIDRIPPQEGDERVAQVTVGAMRNSLAVAEAYEAAVKSQNRAAEAGQMLLVEANQNAVMVDAAKEAGLKNTVSGFLLGILGGTILVLVVR